MTNIKFDEPPRPELENLVRMALTTQATLTFPDQAAPAFHSPQHTGATRWVRPILAAAVVAAILVGTVAAIKSSGSDSHSLQPAASAPATPSTSAEQAEIAARKALAQAAQKAQALAAQKAAAAEQAKQAELAEEAKYPEASQVPGVKIVSPTANERSHPGGYFEGAPFPKMLVAGRSYQLTERFAYLAQPGIAATPAVLSHAALNATIHAPAPFIVRPGYVYSITFTITANRGKGSLSTILKYLDGSGSTSGTYSIVGA